MQVFRFTKWINYRFYMTFLGDMGFLSLFYLLFYKKIVQSLDRILYQVLVYWLLICCVMGGI